jgi:hypothetical protein
VVGPDLPPQWQRHIEQPLLQLGSIARHAAHAGGLGRGGAAKAIWQQTDMTLRKAMRIFVWHCSDGSKAAEHIDFEAC